MADPKPPFVRNVLTHGVGVGFGVLMAVFFWARDAFKGDVSPWPRWAIEYGLVPVLGGILYGCFYGWLDRRSARRS